MGGLIPEFEDSLGYRLRQCLKKLKANNILGKSLALFLNYITSGIFNNAKQEYTKHKTVL